MRVGMFVATSAVCLCGLTHATVAADMPLKAYAPPIVLPAYDWSGLYVGVNAGAGWSNRSPDIAGVDWHDLFSTEFIGGLQLGYNLHSGHFFELEDQHVDAGHDNERHLDPEHGVHDVVGGPTDEEERTCNHRNDEGSPGERQDLPREFSERTFGRSESEEPQIHDRDRRSPSKSRTRELPRRS